MPFFIMLMSALGLFNSLKGMLTLMCFKLYTLQKTEFGGTLDKKRIKQWYLCHSKENILISHYSN